MSDLKPCPFCGGEAYKKLVYGLDEVSSYYDINTYVVGCRKCGIYFAIPWNEDYAVRLWNRRANNE